MTNAMEILSSPWDAQFYDLVTSAQTDLLLMSPFISKTPLENIRRIIDARGSSKPLQVSVITNLAINSIVGGSLDLDALVGFVKAVPETQVTYLPSLHAKVYIADSQTAVVTSGNLTIGGLKNNHEYGVLMREPGLVAQIRIDLLKYASLGSLVPIDMLHDIGEATKELKAISKAADKTIQTKIRAVVEQRTEFARLELLKIRAKGKTTHGIFSDTIIYLLRQRGPLSTADLQPLIQQIHPDLCDDTIDRVIDGVHFGKKWKHHVRNAQLFLKRKKVIALDGERWSLSC